MRRIILPVLIAAIAACRATSPPEPTTISWQLDAPYCGTMRIERRIDGVLIGRDMLNHGVATTPIAVAPGTHTVSARMLYFVGDDPVYVWPDTTYVLAEGQRITRVLPLYCS